MKDYKWGKGLAWMGVCALLGAVLGSGMIFALGFIEANEIKSILIAFAPNLFVLATISGVVGLCGCLFFNSLLKKDGYSNEEGSLYERYENKMGVILSLSTACAILNMTAFGVNLTSEIGAGYFVLFMLNVAIAFMGEVANIALVKKVRPELSADPVNPGFNKNYFDQLDECEKIEVGRASYKTISSMLIVYLTTFVICWILVGVLDISPIICLPVGIIWLVQTMLMVYHSMTKKK
ncbi:MAG: DUF3169 family protein [Cellulosilyticaceae bacterium]